jgi:hypothetical protein
MAYSAHAVRVTHEALDALRDKYATMLAMRVAHDSGEEDAAEVRVRMAELASRFPGALRELDDLELDDIRCRIAALEEVLRGAREVEPWMEAVALFHALARGALSAKRWLAGRKRIDAAVRGAFAAEASALDFPEEARAWTDDLARIASPPRGRVLDVIFPRLARTLGTSEAAARQLVFGAPRRERKQKESR